MAICDSGTRTIRWIGCYTYAACDRTIPAPTVRRVLQKPVCHQRFAFTLSTHRVSSALGVSVEPANRWGFDHRWVPSSAGVIPARWQAFRRLRPFTSYFSSLPDSLCRNCTSLCHDLPPQISRLSRESPEITLTSVGINQNNPNDADHR